MKKKNVAIIFGGKSNEYKVSLQSAAAVLDNLDLARYSPILIGITNKGNWLKFQGNTVQIRDDTWHSDASCVPVVLSPCRDKSGIIVLHDGEYSLVPIDAVFPILHGKNGEDGRLQGLLELAGIPFVGCDMLSSAICMDKAVAHSLVQMAGIQVPRSIVIDRGDRDTETVIAAAGLQFPLYIKPAKSGSSIGITKVSKLEHLRDAIEHSLAHDDKAVIEESVEGFEVGCALLGNENPLIGELDEVQLAGVFFDFHEKYSLANSIIHVPARLDRETSMRIKKTALQIYRTLGCNGFARVDMFLTPEKEIVFNEVNTIPGFTENSRYPKMLLAAGLSFSEIIDRLIDLALTGGINK
jgi:D-alanine---D-serine ligase